MRRLPLLPLLTVLAVIGIALAQICGVHRNYSVEVDGLTIETAAEHHHPDEHLAASHLVSYAPHDHDDDHDDDHDAGDTTEHHAALKLDLSAPHFAFVAFAPLAADLVVAELPDFLAPLLLLAGEEIVLAPPPDPGGRSPPASLLVAKHIVFLV